MADYFDRQLRIANWDQSKVSNTVALCLGAGGLGSYVSVHLVRLGVKKVILIDYDVVDSHNLNRQILYGTRDIGRPKVEAAKDALAMHNLVSEVETYNMDIVKEWSRVVALAREATVIFNMIDYGDYFDLSAQSLALHLKVPLIMGGTFSSCLTIDLFLPEGKPCLLCMNDGLSQEIVDRLTPDLISSYDSLSFLPK
jgi:molybdopterin/thiamine biosynthesis adenylyltransferase